MNDIKIAYFGGEPLGVPVLAILKEAGILPSLIVCNPDMPVGRKHTLTPPSVKIWAKENNIEVFQPETLSKPTVGHRMSNSSWDLFIVVAYSKIMPSWLINLPTYKTVNMHPSLLPKLRGASPIRTAILNDARETGVSIMQVDEKMDHGPILAQKTVEISVDSWPLHGSALDELLANAGGQLLAQTIPDWIDGNITPHDQDHKEVTYTKKISRPDGEIHLADDPYQNYLKICAYDGWPGTFFIENNKRIKITKAQFSEGKLCLERVIPEGKKEMGYTTYLSTHKQ